MSPSRGFYGRAEAVVEAFSGLRIMVIGDQVVDRYVFAEPARLSREAPVVIGRHTGERLIPGGAANAARNLVALGAEVVPLGVVGDDEPGAWLVEHYRSGGLSVEGIQVEAGYKTISKTRFLVGEANRTKQQVLRIDREPAGPPEAGAREGVFATLDRLLPEVDAVLLSDYGYGVVVAPLVERVLGSKADRPVTVDSRYRLLDFKGLTLATPNQIEVEEALGVAIRDDEELEIAGRRLISELKSDSLLITRGNQGMSLFREGEARVDIPATGETEVTDVSGAGDTVIAVVTMALAAKAAPELASRIANVAAGVTVMKPGAATCSPRELLSAMELCDER